MTAVVSPTDVRAIKALEIAATADRWLHVCVTDGQVAYAIPSQFKPGSGYVVDIDSCTCPDFEQRREACKHLLAVRLHLERRRRSAPRPVPPPREYTPDQLQTASALYERLYPV